MKISRKKSKIILSILSIFFTSLLITPFIPVWAENDTIEDIPGEAWDGEITDPIPEPTEPKKPAEEVPESPTDIPTPKEETPSTPTPAPTPAPTTEPTTPTIQISTKTTPKTTVVTNTPTTSEPTTTASSDEVSSPEVKVIEVLETQEENKEEIEVPETAAPSKSPKFTQKMRKITLMSLTASGIVFFTGIILWASWKIKNLSPEQKSESQN